MIAYNVRRLQCTVIIVINIIIILFKHLFVTMYAYFSNPQNTFMHIILQNILWLSNKT